MKKKILQLISGFGLSMAILVGCGSNSSANNQQALDEGASAVSPIEESELAGTDANVEENISMEAESSKKSLIVYFSPSNSDTADSITSATPRVGETSVVEYIAQMIGNEVDADMAKIVPDTAYSIVYDEAAEQAKSEKDNNGRPTFSLDVNPEDYDTIFVGYPVWWYGFPMIMETFFDTYDFSGKTIIPFTTHLGSRDGGTHAEIEALEPDATVLDGIAISADDVEDAGERVSEWLAGLEDSISTLQSESIEERSIVASNEVNLELEFGTEYERGFLNNNVLHGVSGDIHFSSYIPEDYDDSKRYSLFITLPGWEGLYFQGVGANMVEDFGTEALKYKEDLIVLSTQLDDWGVTSAEMTIELTEYFLSNYNIDPESVYLHGMSGGGETGSLVMEKRPDLYTAFLITSSKWDGDLNPLSEVETPVYLVTGGNDSYYGSSSFLSTYKELYSLYTEKGLSEERISDILVLDLREDQYFIEKGYEDQHMGGQAFAHEEEIMSWLFSK